MRIRFVSIAVVAVTCGVASAGVAPAQTLAAVTLPSTVLADGQPLAAGTYEVRITGEGPDAAVGQSPAGARWVEFTRGGTVAGREVATVVPASEIGAIAKGPRPGNNSARVDVLRGGDYVRVWIHRGAAHYIIHLPPAR